MIDQRTPAEKVIAAIKTTENYFLARTLKGLIKLAKDNNFQNVPVSVDDICNAGNFLISSDQKKAKKFINVFADDSDISELIGTDITLVDKIVDSCYAYMLKVDTLFASQLFKADTFALDRINSHGAIRRMPPEKQIAAFATELMKLMEVNSDSTNDNQSEPPSEDQSELNSELDSLVRELELKPNSAQEEKQTNKILPLPAIQHITVPEYETNDSPKVAVSFVIDPSQFEEGENLDIEHAVGMAIDRFNSSYTTAKVKFTDVTLTLKKYKDRTKVSDHRSLKTPIAYLRRLPISKDEGYKLLIVLDRNMHIMNGGAFPDNEFIEDLTLDFPVNDGKYAGLSILVIPSLDTVPYAIRTCESNVEFFKAKGIDIYEEDNKMANKDELNTNLEETTAETNQEEADLEVADEAEDKSTDEVDIPSDTYSEEEDYDQDEPVVKLKQKTDPLDPCFVYLNMLAKRVMLININPNHIVNSHHLDENFILYLVLRALIYSNGKPMPIEHILLYIRQVFGRYAVATDKEVRFGAFSINIHDIKIAIHEHNKTVSAYHIKNGSIELNCDCAYILGEGIIKAAKEDYRNILESVFDSAGNAFINIIRSIVLGQNDSERVVVELQALLDIGVNFKPLANYLSLNTSSESDMLGRMGKTNVDYMCCQPICKAIDYINSDITLKSSGVNHLRYTLHSLAADLDVLGSHTKFLDNSINSISDYYKLSLRKAIDPMVNPKQLMHYFIPSLYDIEIGSEHELGEGRFSDCYISDINTADTVYTKVAVNKHYNKEWFNVDIADTLNNYLTAIALKTIQRKMVFLSSSINKYGIDGYSMSHIISTAITISKVFINTLLMNNAKLMRINTDIFVSMMDEYYVLKHYFAKCTSDTRFLLAKNYTTLNGVTSTLTAFTKRIGLGINLTRVWDGDRINCDEIVDGCKTIMGAILTMYFNNIQEYAECGIYHLTEHLNYVNAALDNFIADRIGKTIDDNYDTCRQFRDDISIEDLERFVHHCNTVNEELSVQTINFLITKLYRNAELMSIEKPSGPNFAIDKLYKNFTFDPMEVNNNEL